MSDWIEVNKPVRECSEIASTVGNLIEVNERGTVEQYLIGNVNSSHGLCGCCVAFHGGETLLRYKKVFTPEDEAT